MLDIPAILIGDIVGYPRQALGYGTPQDGLTALGAPSQVMLHQMYSAGIVQIVRAYVGGILPIEALVSTSGQEIRLRAGCCSLHGLIPRGFHSPNAQ